jgi:HEPN domain-containing protein
MTPFSEEAERLLRLARRDYQTCAILGSHPEAQIAPICFHAQQCVEKSLKAALTARQVYFRYTHDLSELTNLLTGAGITPPFTAAELHRCRTSTPYPLGGRIALRRRSPAADAGRSRPYRNPNIGMGGIFGGEGLMTDLAVLVDQVRSSSRLAPLPLLREVFSNV